MGAKRTGPVREIIGASLLRRRRRPTNRSEGMVQQRRRPTPCAPPICNQTEIDAVNNLPIGLLGRSRCARSLATLYWKAGMSDLKARQSEVNFEDADPHS